MTTRLERIITPEGRSMAVERFEGEEREVSAIEFLIEAGFQSFLNNFNPNLVRDIEQDIDDMKYLISQIPDELRQGYLEGYADTVASDADKYPYFLDVFWDAGARDILSMTFHALQEPETSSIFAQWLRSRADIGLEATIRDIEDDYPETAEFLRTLPIDGVFNGNSALGGRGLD